MIFVGVPVWHGLDVKTAHCLSSLMVGAKDTVHLEMQEGDGLISRSRSTLASKALESGADVMVMIDADIQFEPADFIKLVKSARATGQIIAGVYVTREKKPRPTIVPYPGTELAFVDSPDPNLMEVLYASAGFMAVPRKVLQDMTEAEFQTINGPEVLWHSRGGPEEGKLIWDFYRMMVVRDSNGLPWWLEESYSFCERARQIGYKVYADTSVFIAHRATVSMTIFDVETPGHAYGEQGLPAYEGLGLVKEVRA